MAVYTVTAKEKITLCEKDPVERIAQNVVMCIRTKKGTVPMYRKFGCDQQYVDMPYPVACAIARAEITKAITEFEPRVNIVRIDFNKNEETGKLLPIVEVEINA